MISTQVARRFVERFFGRLDARTASFDATRELMERAFPATYRVLSPGADLVGRAATRADGPLRIAFLDHEDRQALRLFLRALRRLPDEPDWRATVFTPVGARTSALRSRVRDHVDVVTAEDTSEAAVLAAADVVVAASVGQAPAPGLLVRALGAGAVPVAARLPAYEEVLRDGELGLLFEPGDAETLAAQLTRLLVDAAAARVGSRARWPRARRSSRGAGWRSASRRSTARSRRAGIRRARTARCARGSPPAG